MDDLIHVPGQEWLDGKILLLDKPYGWSSFQLVKKVRVMIERAYGLRKLKVGHAGTLDPLATGLMIVGVGKATKQLERLHTEDKEYEATIRLGATTPCYDLEKEIDQTFPYEHISEEDVINLFSSFTGEIEQIPPLFSAKKIDGVRAYKHARKGRDKVLEASLIRIDKLDLTLFNLPEISFTVKCSKGTYIRALARDIGVGLHSGAHLTKLRRTASGMFTVNEAQTLEEFEKTFELS